LNESLLAKIRVSENIAGRYCGEPSKGFSIEVPTVVVEIHALIVLFMPTRDVRREIDGELQPLHLVQYGNAEIRSRPVRRDIMFVPRAIYRLPSRTFALWSKLERARRPIKEDRKLVVFDTGLMQNGVIVVLCVHEIVYTVVR
jgi:hypothetical protein